MTLEIQSKIPEWLDVDPDARKLTTAVGTYYDIWGIPKAHFGLMQRNLIDGPVYAWAQVCEASATLGDIRRGRAEVKDYFSSLPWEIFAEAEDDSERDKSFLLFLGFETVAVLSGRAIMKWRN